MYRRVGRGKGLKGGRQKVTGDVIGEVMDSTFKEVGTFVISLAV
jgi:hypothetical protein